MHNPDFCYIKFYRENAGGKQSERQNAGRGRGGEAGTGNKMLNLYAMSINNPETYLILIKSASWGSEKLSKSPQVTQWALKPEF